MLKLETTGQFRRDYKKMMKRGYDRTLLEKVVDILHGEIRVESEVGKGSTFVVRFRRI